MPSSVFPSETTSSRLTIGTSRGRFADSETPENVCLPLGGRSAVASHRGKDERRHPVIAPVLNDARGRWPRCLRFRCCRRQWPHERRVEAARRTRSARFGGAPPRQRRGVAYPDTSAGRRSGVTEAFDTKDSRSTERTHSSIEAAHTTRRTPALKVIVSTATANDTARRQPPREDCGPRSQNARGRSTSSADASHPLHDQAPRRRPRAGRSIAGAAGRALSSPRHPRRPHQRTRARAPDAGGTSGCNSPRSSRVRRTAPSWILWWRR